MVRCGWIEITSVAIAALFFVKSFAERSVENAASFDTAIEKLLGGPFLPFPSDEELMESNRYSCDDEPEKPPKKTLNIRGTSLGGWLVLEPWITPSLFYQFLGATDGQGRFQGNVALDSYTFCEVLGGKEANRQLRIHWRYWVTERQIRNLAELGLNTVRIPIADWMFAPYYPFTNGCWEGALEELDRVVDLCQKYGLDVLLDMHAVRGSQNGLDNSGDTRHYEWINGTHFRHWDIRGGDWAGQYDAALRQYVTTNETQLLNTLAAIQQVALRYANRSAVVGLQPVNEPWDAIPWPVVREFYWRSYRLLRHLAPNWIVMFHDSFRLGTSTDSVWLAPHPSASASKTSPRFKASKGNGRAEDQRFLAHCTHYMVDIHVYQAWAWDPYDVDYFLRTTCDMGQRLRRMEDAGIAVVVGEWSLATDNCAMWLNGLNDNVPGYPKAACQRVPCPAPYFPAERARIPNAPVNRSAGRQGPFGLGGDSYVEYGTCVVDSTHNRCNVTAPSTYNTSELLQRIRRQGAAAIDDDTLALVRFYRRNIVAAFAAAQWSAFNLHTHGQFFWNFRTELEDTWDIQRATAPHLQWLPRNMSAHDADAQRMAACGCVGYDHGDAADKPLPPGDEDYWLFSAASASAQALWVMVAVVVVGLALSAGLWLWCRPACADRPDESQSLCRCPPHWLSTGPLSWWSDTFRGHRGGYSSIASAGVPRDYGDEATSVEVYVQPSSYRRVSAGGAPPTSSTTDDSKVELMPLTAVNKAAHDRRYKELEETGGGYVKPYAFSYQRASHTSNQT